MIEKIGMCCACGGSYSKAQTPKADPSGPREEKHD